MGLMESKLKERRNREEDIKGEWINGKGKQKERYKGRVKWMRGG